MPVPPIPLLWPKLIGLSDVITVINGHLTRAQNAKLEHDRQALQRELQRATVQASAGQHTATLAQQRLHHEESLAQQRHLLQARASVDAQIAMHNRTSQLMVAQKQRENAMEQIEENFIFNQWPLRISPQQLLQPSDHDGVMPLKVLVVPVELTHDEFRSSPSSMGYHEERLTTQLQRFLQQYYPHESGVRPVQFYNGAWRSRRFSGMTSVKVLHYKLASEPLLVLQLTASGNSFDLSVAYWGFGQPKFIYRSIAPDVPVSIVDGDSEERDRLLGNLLCLVVAWFADVHHLLHSPTPQDVPPVLPSIGADWLGAQGTPMRTALTPIAQGLIAQYHEPLEALAAEQLTPLPLLSARLADMCSVGGNAALARSYIDVSLDTRARILGVQQVRDGDLGRLLDPQLCTEAELPYLRSLERSMHFVGDERVAQVAAIAAELRKRVIASDLI